MQRKNLYLAAATAESVRFFALSFLAAALGGLREGDGLSVLFRYAAAPQLLFIVTFFFLWLDKARYGAYRPLLYVGKAISLATFVPLFISMAQRGSGAAFSGQVAPISALVAVGVDLFGVFVLLMVGKSPGDEGQERLPGSRTQVPSVQGNEPRGPEDIERVEG